MMASRRQRKVTIAEVAREAGVTIGSVSRALNRDPTLRARPETIRRIHEAAARLSYTPSHAGRALRLSQASALAVVLPDVANPLNAEILGGIEDEAGDAGYEILVGRAERLAGTRGSLRNLVAGGRVDGVLLQRPNDIEDRELSLVADIDIPIVFFNSRLPDRAGSVILDDEAGTQLATNYLIGLGHTKLAHLTGPSATDTAARRLAGFRRTVAAAGLRVPGRWIVEGGASDDAGARGMRRLISRSPRPTAVVVANVVAAMGALKAAQDAGVAVPGDLSLVAFHDMWFASHTTPGLTCVRMPLRELGRAGVSALLRQVDGGAATDIVVRSPAPVLEVRASAAPPGTRRPA